MNTIKSTYHNFLRHDFKVNQHEAILVEPKSPAAGNPWIWRTEFFGAFDYADMAMVENGWHLAYVRLSDMYGCPEAVREMGLFHDYLLSEFLLSPKTVLFGFSRGGLYAFNYAAAYPDRTALLYLDAPVLDIKSWPGGLGTGIGSRECWAQCLEIYGLDEETVNDFKDNPLDKAQAVAQAGIPLLIVAGDTDEVVPYDENGKIMTELFNRYNSHIKVIIKPGIGHHPHSLENPYSIVDFILKNYNSCMK